MPAVLEALNRADAERRALLAELKQATKRSVQQAAQSGRRSDLRRTLRGYLDDWHAMIQGNVAEARGLLDLVLRERIPFKPIVVKQQACYELTVPIAFDRVLMSVVPMLEQGGGESRWRRHDHGSPMCRANATDQSVAVPSFNDRNDTRAERPRDLNRAVGASVVRDDDFPSNP